MNITASVTGGTQPYTYQWTTSPAAGNLSCTNCPNPVFTPTSNANLFLTVTDAKGCTNSVVKSINSANTSGWIGGFVNPLLRPVPTVKTGSNLVADKNSNVYYTGSDGKIYYYYFDVPGNQWLLSQPIATNASGPIALHEPVAGQKILYYISSVTNFINKVVFDGTSWGAATQVNTNGIKGNLAIDQSNGNLYYRDNNDNLSKYDPNTSASTIINTQISGQTILVANSEIYYFKPVNGNNVLYKTDITGNTHTQLTTTYAAPNSSIAVDNSGNVYFADWSNIYYLKKNGTTYLNPVVISNKSANGYFTINTATSVIYYITYDQNIYQCFYNGQQWINTKTASDYYPYPQTANPAYGDPTYPASSIIYKSPHAFYIDVSRNVSNLFYFTGCTPQYERLSLAASEDYLPETIENYSMTNDQFICYPNPFVNNTNINYTVDEISPVKIAVHTILGSEIKVLIDAGKHETGTFNVNFDAAELSSGVYLCNYYKNNVLVKTNKLIIQK